MTLLLIAEHHQQQLAANTTCMLNAAKTLSEDIDLLIVSDNCDKLCQQAQNLPYLQKILTAEHPDHRHLLAEKLVEVIQQVEKNYSTICAPANTFGKNFMPRLAAVLDVAQISDIIDIKATDTFVRPIYAGNALETVQLLEKKQILTFRPTAFEAIALKENNKENNPAVTITPIALPDTSPKLSKHVKTESTPCERPELTQARVVISGGRGLQAADNFKLLEALATKLNAAIGASRAAVDAGFVPNDYQVGQTGKIVAPELYIAIGISGAIQHVAGMKDSKIIVAINKDEEAPIFQLADYGLVGDLFEIVPKLTSLL